METLQIATECRSKDDKEYVKFSTIEKAQNNIKILLNKCEYPYSNAYKSYLFSELEFQKNISGEIHRQSIFNDVFTY